MNKITIFKIGLAGGLYNLLALLFVSLVGQIHIRAFSRLTMMMMQKYGPFGYNLSFSGILSGCLWALILGFIQFGAIALIFNILSTKNSVTNTVSRWFKSSEK
jgi:hypothetical protein